MKRFLLCISYFLLCAPCFIQYAHAVDDTTSQDTIYISLVNQCVDAFPMALVDDVEETENTLKITALDGNIYEYNWQHILNYGKEAPEYPRFTSFKFNNKYNDDVYSDVQCEIDDKGLITASVPCIGHRLTPSFGVSDELAVAYVNGVRQVSKKSRHRFDKAVNYLVCHPGHRILAVDKEDEPEPEPVIPTPSPSEEIVEPVSLTADMFSTNAPSNYGEDPANLLDGDLGTMFHSTWGTGAYEKLPADSCPYLDIHLPEALHHLQFSYTNRNSDGRYSTGLCLYASNNGMEWDVIRDFDVDADNLPTPALGVYHSPIIDLGGDYSYLRIEQTKCAYRNNYLAWAEFALWKVTLPKPSGTDDDPIGQSGGESVETEVDSVALKWVPLGRKYAVVIDWPTAQSSMTPRIDIDIEGGVTVNSKTTYFDACIQIDGAGVFPSLQDSVQIKGRGNSSWNTNAYAKNPYRLKFSSKVKPFGLPKAKSWVLQANAINGSMLCNAIGMKVARLVGAAGANHVIPVELYMNGNYRGSYIFTEKIGFANNSIDIDDESAATMLELDSYFDETYKFRDNAYSLPVNIKEPDFSEPSSTRLTMDAIISDFSRFTDAVKNKEDISYYCDVDAFAAFYLTNDLVENIELMHPKSTYLYKENIHSSLSKYTFGPVWDLDWGFGYENYHSYFPSETDATITEAHSMEKNQFWRDLRQCGEPLDRAYYKAWKNFLENGLEELLEYCDD